MTGHRLGLLISAPMVLLGWSAGLNRAHLRHIGCMPNGNPSRYPNYVQDGAPTIVKHRVSTRSREVPDYAPTAVSLSPEAKAKYLAEVAAA